MTNSFFNEKGKLIYAPMSGLYKYSYLPTYLSIYSTQLLILGQPGLLACFAPPERRRVWDSPKRRAEIAKWKKNDRYARAGGLVRKLKRPKRVCIA